MKQCPCGKFPGKLEIQDAGQGGKWAFVFGDCCGEWGLEFRSNYYGLDSDECMELALEAWNGASRDERIASSMVCEDN